MLQRNGESQTINFLLEKILGKHNDPSQLKYSEKAKKQDNQKPEHERLSDIRPATRSDNSRAIEGRGGQILTAGGGSIRDTGGPRKHMGSITNNSIWDSGVLQDLAQKRSNDETTAEIKSNVQHLRNSMKEDRIDQMVEDLQNTDLRKDSTVKNTGEYIERGSNYKAPQNHISIFDDKLDFSRVPEKTAGEKSAEESRKEKDKEYDKRRIVSTKSMENSLFENLMQVGKKDEKKGSI